MESLFQYVAPPSQCGYLPDQLWSLEYDMAITVSKEEYLQLLEANWRRFGFMLFRPRCANCNACQSLRVDVQHFRPNRSQRRIRRANESDIRLEICEPSVTKEKLRLYDKYHAYQSTSKGWPMHPAKDAESYVNSFVENPFPIEEWQYYLGNQLIGIGYVDYLGQGMSAIYFYYDPDCRKRGLGVWNVLRIIEECQSRGAPWLYLGYYVGECASLNYKSNFVPNEIYAGDDGWHPFQS